MVRKLLAGLAILAPLAAAADSALLDFIMPDARLVVGVDIDRMRQSPLNASLSKSVQGANPEIRKLMEAAGFDPLRDLQEFLFASPGIGKNPPALLIARGSFDTAKLRAFAQSAGSKVSDFGGVPLLSDPEKASGTFALLDNIILAGNLDQVKAAIERRGHGRILNTEMATRINELSKRYDAWLVSIAPLATMASSLPPDADMKGLTSAAALRAIEQFSLGISLQSDLTFAAEMVMTNAKAAGSLADTLQMVMAMAVQGAQNDPDTIAALKNVNFGVDQNVVRVGLTMPAAELEKTVQAAMQKQFAKGGPMTAARRPAPESVMPTIQQAPAPHETVQQTAVTGEQESETAQQAPATAEPAPAQVASAPAVEPAVPTAATKPAAAVVAKSPRIPANAEIMIQSSPRDMGTVVIIGSKK